MVKSNSSQASFARWWRQVLFVPMLHSKWLTPAAKARLTEQVTLAERGHRGEVFLIIENHLPIQDAYHYDCRDRAIDLFSEYRVWDTHPRKARKSVRQKRLVCVGAHIPRRRVHEHTCVWRSAVSGGARAERIALCGAGPRSDLLLPPRKIAFRDERIILPFLFKTV